jgi:hypothetical protein
VNSKMQCGNAVSVCHTVARQQQVLYKGNVSMFYRVKSDNLNSSLVISIVGASDLHYFTYLSTKFVVYFCKLLQYASKSLQPAQSLPVPICHGVP